MNTPCDSCRRLQEKLTLNERDHQDRLSLITALKQDLEKGESLRVQHARKQGDADGFQQGWHAALLRIAEGDTIETLRDLVPAPPRAEALALQSQDVDLRQVGMDLACERETFGLDEYAEIIGTALETAFRQGGAAALARSAPAEKVEVEEKKGV